METRLKLGKYATALGSCCMGDSKGARGHVYHWDTFVKTARSDGDMHPQFPFPVSNMYCDQATMRQVGLMFGEQTLYHVLSLKVSVWMLQVRYHQPYADSSC